jgi:hypothetical protein
LPPGQGPLEHARHLRRSARVLVARPEQAVSS